MVNKISNETLLAIERKSAKTLPDRPSQAGLTAETIRNRLYKAMLDDTNSLRAEIDRVVDEVNADIEALPLSEYKLDESTTVIDYQLVDDEDKTFSTVATSVKITIPATVEHGFHAGVNFIANATPGAIVFDNQSSIDLVLLRHREIPITNYIPTANKVVNMLFYSDGLKIYCHIIEV